MTEMLRITVLTENYLWGSLLNPDILALSCMRDQAHHRLLSLPKRVPIMQSWETCDVYESCRLSAIIFSTALLFPVPRSTGLPQKLVKDVKQCLEQTNFIFLIDEGVRAFFIWVLVLAGVAADGLPERAWFEESLTDLVIVGGVTRWSEVKKIVESYLWMESGCDSGAMDLWDNVAAAVRDKVDGSVLGYEAGAEDI
jgi:hypothetical protein